MLLVWGVPLFAQPSSVGFPAVLGFSNFVFLPFALDRYFSLLVGYPSYQGSLFVV